VRMFIANYDPSLEDPKQMKLPFGEEGKNPEEDPQLTDHLREVGMGWQSGTPGWQNSSVTQRERLGQQMDSTMEEGGYDPKSLQKQMAVSTLRQKLDTVKDELKKVKTKRHKSALLSQLLNIRDELKNLKTDEA